MDLNSKKLERNSKIIYYTIAIILCLFLILLSNKIIYDLDQVQARPELSQSEDKTIQGELEAKQKILDTELESFSNKSSNLEKTIETARENYTNEKESFDNWVQTRKTLGSPDKDIEVSSRAKKLDEYYKVEQDWREQLNGLQKEIDLKNQEKNQIQAKLDIEYSRTNDRYQSQIIQYELKVFLIRLAFVGPILLLGIFFFIRYRNHKFWPLFFGFTLFSFYCFFFGLLPYLPSYGGYVRSAVGIVLSISLGYYAIKYIRNYLDRKKAELEVPTEERAKKVDIDLAEKSLDNHICPSCGKDFIVKKWDFTPKSVDNDLYKYVTNFCRHCGLELFSNCSKCGNKNFVHLKFCASCGTNISQNKAEA